MKILYVITCGDRGGSQVTLLDLIQHLPDGFEPVVVSGQDGFLRDGCERAGVSFRKIRSLVRDIHPINDVLALVKLVTLIHREHPDLVHAHTSKAGVVARLAAWLTQTPSIFTAHTWSFEDGVPRIVRWLAVPLERLVALVGGPIIVVSDANARKALRRGIAPQDRIFRVWVGIPDAKLTPRPETDRPVTMIMVARFVEQKDQKLLLRALAEVHGDWVLQFVGSGPLLAETQALARELNLGPRVQFLGERSDVTELLSQADIFVFASKWEGLPRVILEAMRAVLPVVATDVGGIGEMVENGVSGFLTPAGSKSELAGSIQALIDSSELRSAMGRAARRRFEEDFRIETCVRKTVAIYRMLHAGSKNRKNVHGEECA